MATERLRIMTPAGVGFAAVPDAGERSALGEYWNGVRRYLRTGDSSDLAQFGGVSVAGHKLETDLDRIDAWARRGELDFDDIYKLSGG